MAFSFFGKKPATDGKAPETGAKDAPGGGAAASTGAKGDDGEKLVVDPASARKFFDWANTRHETEQFEYATRLWLDGLRMDPTSVQGHEKFFESATAFAEQARAKRIKAPTTDQIKAIPDKSGINKYLLALLHWGVNPLDWQLGLKALELAAKLDLGEPGYWLGSKVLAVALKDPKVKKKDLVNMMECFAKLGAFDRAVQAGEAAYRQDPSDATLAVQVRNMSAQATMSKGGYEQSGEAGGFRKNVKDISAQRAREDEERIVKSEDAQARAIENAKQDYEKRSSDPNTVTRYAKLLMERGQPEDEKLAFQLNMKAFEELKTYRFKQTAGDIKMRVNRRKLREIKAALDADPGNAERQSMYQQAHAKIQESELAEYIERVAAYPTDLVLKYELGNRYAELGKHEQAIEQYQVAQNAPGLQVKVLNSLGTCFMAMGWLDEAEGTFRRAIELHPIATDDLAQDLRYGLMNALQRKAEEHQDLAAAEEAFKVAQAMAMQQIGYRDIRQRREALQALVKQLKSKPA